MILNNQESRNIDMEGQVNNISGSVERQVENKNVTIVKSNIRCMIVAFGGFAIIFAFLLLC